MTRLPEDFKLEETNSVSNYFRITDEAQEFRILTSPVIWYEYFRQDWDKVKPVRQKEMFNDWSDSKDDRKPKQFRAFVVYNHNLKKIQIMEITQKSIMKAIVELTKSKDWSNPKEYDLSVIKSWKALETTYSLTPLPKSRFEDDKEWEKALEEAWKVNLEALFSGEDPFNNNPF